MLVVTTENIKGYDYEVIGECFGLTTQSKDIMSNIGAGFKNVVGGEIKAYTQMLQTSRMEAIRRMKQDAKSKGADAIVMMRFDTDSMVEGVQTVVAYGTAVKLKEITTESRSPKE